MTITVAPVAHVHCDERGRLLFSQDENLLAGAVRCQREGTPFATVIFAGQPDLSVGRCIANLVALAQAALPENAESQIIFLPIGTQAERCGGMK